MKYNKMSVGVPQNYIHLYWDFKTKKEARAKAAVLKKKYPKVSFFERIVARTIWINSIIDSGERYFSLDISFHCYELSYILK